MHFPLPLSLRARRTVAACALACVALSGCQSHKVVARINNEAITEEQYIDRVERVTAVNPQTGGDAGGTALVNIIHEMLAAQFAKQKGFSVSDDALNKLTDFLIQSPQYQQQISQNLINRDDLKRGIKNALELTAIGTDGAKADPKDVDAVFKEQGSNFAIPETYVLRILVVPTESQGQVALNSLKVTKDFKAEARKLNIGGRALSVAGQPAYLPATTIQQQYPTLYTALQNLTPGQFAASPVSLPPPPQQSPDQPPGQPSFACVQLVEKRPKREANASDVRPLLEQLALQKKFPQWDQHANQSLSEFTISSAPAIEVNIERYKNLVQNFILPAAESYSATQPGGSLSPGGPPPQGSAPPAGAAPSSPPAGSSAPPTETPPSGSPSAGSPSPGGAAPKAGGKK